jgi:hypothetical protein
MKLYYRISDNSYEKPKLIGADKATCLENFIVSFQKIIYGNEPPLKNCIPPIKIVADNCERKTVGMLSETGLPLKLTNLGNAGSLIYSIKDAINSYNDDDLIYFCEDDYLHAISSVNLLEEGIEIADYVTLYDHPDKYTSQYGGGEISKVVRTRSSHWRYTVSTCMTFAAKIKTIKEDLSVWEKYTAGDHPHDHKIFTCLNETKNRKLAVCLPGAACHTDLTFSGQAGVILIEPWAINFMIEKLSFSLKEKALDPWVQEKNGWKKLVALDSILKQQKLNN